VVSDAMSAAASQPSAARAIAAASAAVAGGAGDWPAKHTVSGPPSGPRQRSSEKLDCQFDCIGRV